MTLGAPALRLPKTLSPDELERLRAVPKNRRDQALIEGLSYRGFDGRALRVAIETDDEGLARWLASQAGEVAGLVRRATSRRLDVTIEPQRSVTTTGSP